MIKRSLLAALALTCLTATQVLADTELQATVPGSLIRFENNGNITLNGHCYANLPAVPTDGVMTLFNGMAAAKNGNLYFRGALATEAVGFPDFFIVRTGTTPLAGVNTSGTIFLKGRCNNTAGCSNTRWEPTRWNDGGAVQGGNNCYNYGNDKITGTFAQPGRASGSMNTVMSVVPVRDAAIRDGLRFIGTSFPGNTYDCGDGHLVFMAVWPGFDYHWWRYDHAGGSWTHKPGGTQATIVDNSGHGISNPLTADRGGYTDAGGFFCTCGSLANIN